MGNLSASDLRGLTSPEAFAHLLSPAADYQAAQHGGVVPAVGTVTPATTFGKLLDMLVGAPASPLFFACDWLRPPAARLWYRLPAAGRRTH